MAQIGQFTRDKSGFAGRIQTLTVTRDLYLVPADFSDAENADNRERRSSGTATMPIDGSIVQKG